MRNLWSPFVLLVVLVFSVPLALGEDVPKTGGLKITSPVFENNRTLPPRYTCDGKNINPPLMIENVPRQAKSLALILDDQDAPRGSYVHWIVWNIDPGIKDIREDSVPEGAMEGTNDFKKRNYGGPCPPTRAHRYAFKLYVLDIRLTLEPRSTKADLEKAMKGHILAQTQLITSYKKVGK
jgi:Raf kinase inhibitor-like YbhB/YbcL family protein